MRKKWHAIPLEKIFAETGSERRGLTNFEASERLKKFGRNALPQEKPYSKIRLFLSQFKRTIFRKDIFSNRYLVGAVVVAAVLLVGAVYLPPLQKLLATQSLDIAEWAIIFGISLVEILLIEFSKKRIFVPKK